MTEAIWISLALMTLPVHGWGVECAPGQPHLMLLAGPVTHADVDVAPPATTVNAITSLVALPEQGELLVVGSVLATTGSGRSMSLWRYFSGECPLVFRDHFEAVAVSP